MLMPVHDETDAFRAITLAIAGIVAMDFLAYWWLANLA
jgi:hypothetical protein